MKFSTTALIAAFAATAAAETCFPSWICDSIGAEGFSCDSDDCRSFRASVRDQLYAGAGIMFSNGDDASRAVAERKLAAANAVNNYINGN
ncbi:hypothetical protein A1Q2_00014 [Trichosporon asahii var. asahii CBS 8904]|uniref:Uncharacterized protein n=2 Tax=Trichosporon asahii var. asahii TaxID=189963 RepID=K1VNB9_TRIAC|nr:hypothetical protein A1Q1_01050 [Trichosporon asahii var. asahii CBS 2479]EJT49793.1 hypothetical protein A1Q1_01050 [Trichosporon asahii var. asahii CBS 2479]EKD05690.1 hypothetical protein A1Q2_00014 [Trichosporon asahii var. asahii CBS 8904]